VNGSAYAIFVFLGGVGGGLLVAMLISVLVKYNNRRREVLPFADPSPRPGQNGPIQLLEANREQERLNREWVEKNP
jgi:hypothetical protein